ncbi:MAG: preprotein translocase subunit YajC [Clostridia bacterium]|nr:preprotein translocase subunit YajC [Clostridia bacterium]
MFTRFLLEEAAESAAKPGIGNTWWIYVVLILLVVAMLVLPTITNKKREKEYNSMLDKIRVGDEVRTIGGVIGRITKISEKNGMKSFILETGARGSKTTMEFDMAAIGMVLKSTYVEEEKKEEPAEEKKEETAEVKTEEPAVETAKEAPKAEAKKPAKKTGAKKATAKRVSKK